MRYMYGALAIDFGDGTESSHRLEGPIRIDCQCGCLLPRLKLRRSVSPHFWVNVIEPDMAVPGIIEF
jgi:hypothetical protein